MYSLLESPQIGTLISNSKLFNVSFRNDQDDLLKELLMFFHFQFCYLPMMVQSKPVTTRCANIVERERKKWCLVTGV